MFFLCFAGWGQVDTLRLDQALQLARQNSIQQLEARTRYESAALEAGILRSRLRPQLSFNANLPNYFETSLGITQPNGSIAFQNISQNNTQAGLFLSQAIARTNTNVFVQTDLIRFDDFTDEMTNYNGVPVRLGIQQGINQFNALKWDKRILPLTEMVVQKRSAVETASHLVDVTQQYFALLRVQVNQQIATSNIESNQKILEIAEERFELGKISKAELLQVQLGAANSQQDLIAAQRQVSAEAYRLQALMNVFPDSVLATAPTDLPTTDIEAEEAVRLAWSNHPNRQNLELQLLTAQRDIDRAKKDNGFQAFLQASVGLTKNAATLPEVYDNPNNEILVNLSLSVPLYDGGIRRQAVKQAQLSYDLAEQRRQFIENDFERNVRQLVLQTNTLRREVALSETSYQIAQQRYRISNERYALGNISITDLTIAFGERDQAWRNYINTLSNYWTNHQLLEALTANTY